MREVVIEGNQPTKTHRRRWPLNTMGNWVAGLAIGAVILLVFCCC